MTSKYDFTGALALVTGGGSGMGRQVAKALAEAGATIIAADINLIGATETVQGLKGTNHAAFKVDVSSESSVNDLAAYIASNYNRCPSIVIHAAGIVVSQNRQSVFEVKFDELNRVIDINLKGTFLINKAFGQWMRDEKVQGGAIVNFSSLAGRTGTPSIADYCASKSGVNSLTQSFAKELISAGIRVNAVAPFFIQTPMLGEFSKPLVERSIALNPAKRVGLPEEVVSVCLFLASKDSSFVNGEIVQITGGL